MCGNPLMMIGAQAMGAASSAMGAYGEVKSQKSALGFQAQMLDLNAQLAERRAQIALEQGAYQAAEIERGGARLKGEQRAALGARGIALDSTTAQAVVSGSEMVTAEDAYQARVNATRAAWGHRVDATNIRNEALATRTNAKGLNARNAATNSLLTSASSMAQSYYNMRRVA